MRIAKHEHHKILCILSAVFPVLGLLITALLFIRNEPGDTSTAENCLLITIVSLIATGVLLWSLHFITR